MSAPRSLRAAFEACHPLRKTFPQTRPLAFYRSFYSSRNPVLVEPSPSPSEIPSNPNNHQPTLDSATEQTITTTTNDAANKPSSSSSSSSSPPPPNPRDDQPLRAPRSVQASYLRPLRHPPIYGHPVCNLQLRSFSARNLEFMADFALRAAYYLGLPAKGPTPLPKRVQRWTVLKSNFVNKKSQENFERVTLRRLVQIQDGDAEVVKIWLAYLRRFAFWGVGMKANVWEWEGLDVAANMDKAFTSIEADLDAKLSSFGWKSDGTANARSIPKWLREQDNRLPGVPMMEMRKKIAEQKKPHVTERV